MSSEFYAADKPPAPPVRLASAREVTIPVDMRPLPKEPDRDEEKRKAKLKLTKNAKKDKNSSEKPVISPPTNFEHTVHVGFDAITGEFTGMPPNWAQLLQNSNISKTEQKKNPQAVLDVLKWYDSSAKAKDEKYMTINRNLGIYPIVYSLCLHLFLIWYNFLRFLWFCGLFCGQF